MAKRCNRLANVLVLALVIVSGLLSRSSLAELLPTLIATYAGDTLWSLALFLTLGILFPGARTFVIALLTLFISFAVEISQLYQAAWINQIRNTRIGALLLGSGFKWSDLPCYTIGTFMGVAGEILASFLRKHPDQETTQ